MSENVVGLPENTRSVIIKFGLTDMNVRRDYASLVMYQVGSSSKLDLTNYFFVGPERMPVFGQTTEIMMPWDMSCEQKLCIEFQVAPQQPIAPPMYGNPYGGYPGMPPHMSGMPPHFAN